MREEQSREEEEYGWDDYDRFIVVAESEEDAWNIMLNSEHSNGEVLCSTWQNWEVIQVDLNEKGIICESYNAG